MVTAVPSRFAVLSIEDDDYKPKNVQKSIKLKDNTTNKEEKQKHRKRNDKKKQNKEKRKDNVDRQQWEQWKEKDSIVVEETYEQELHEAILLSKLSYQEAQTEIKSGIRNNQESIKKRNKKSKKSTMSLEQFKNLNITLMEYTKPELETENNSLKDKAFFRKIEKETSQILIREKENATLKKRLNQVDDSIISTQLRIEIEKRDHIIKMFETEVEKLKEELCNVKNRNKKLYQILQQGEMKDKAAVLAEVTKLQEIRDELTSEISSLHVQLEQERSKTRASNTDIKTTK